jgi:uncharacterized protein with FMN-binding domain
MGANEKGGKAMELSTAGRNLRRLFSALALAAAVAAFASGCKVDKAAFVQAVDLREVDLASVPDGSYEAAFAITPPPGAMAANKSVKVRVTVTAGRYERIELLEPPKLGDSGAMRKLLSRVTTDQSLSPDAIASATITSVAILKAIQKAAVAAGGRTLP